MTTFTPTHHAKSRMQQRGMREDILPLLLNYGDMRDAPHGAVAITGSNKCVNEAIAACKRLIKRLEKMRGKTIIASDGLILTVYRNNSPKGHHRRSRR